LWKCIIVWRLLFFSIYTTMHAPSLPHQWMLLTLHCANHMLLTFIDALVF
jgi:hypothetical protein